MKTTKTRRYNLRRIMENAWFFFKARKLTFPAALRKAWRIEKNAVLWALIEGRDLAAEDRRAEELAAIPAVALTIPADYYGDRNRYYGD